MLHRFAHPLRRLEVAALLDAMEATHQLRRRDGFHGQSADPRKDVQLQMPHHLPGIADRPLAILLRLGMPGARRQLEGVEARYALALLFFATRLPGVDAARPLLRFGSRLLARRRQRDHGVVPEAQLGFLARLLVSIDPYLAARPHTKVQPLAVCQQIFLVTRLRRLDRKVVELSHGVPKT